jgi:integrase
MTAQTIKTMGQAYDSTWRLKWRHSKACKTAKINAKHVLDYAGRSLPLSRVKKTSWWLEFISDLRDEGRNTSTINRIVSNATTMVRFTRAAGLHEIDVPPFLRPKEGEHRMTYFSKEQVQQLAFTAVDIFDNKALADAIIFSAYTGVRQGELLKLKSEDFDPALNQIWVGGKPGRDTKAGDCRNITLHPLVEPIVKDRLAQAYLFRDDWTNKDQLYAAFKKVRKFCSITEDHCWHSLRHSFGTFLGEQTHPRQIMALMGHKQISTSLRYVKATDAATRSAVLAI